MSSLEDDISNKEIYSTLTEVKLREAMKDLMFFKNESPRQMVLYTGLYGIYNFDFHLGGVGSPNNYHHHGSMKHCKYIYITLGVKQSNIKCKVRMSRKVNQIEVYNGTNLLFSSNHFDDVYKRLKKLNIKIVTYNKRLRIYEKE